MDEVKQPIPGGIQVPLEPESFRNLAPRETGGIENRQGIEFQDHVAAACCIHMLGSSNQREVWCETHDDLVVVWLDGANEIPEYVQVKGAEFNQLWTIHVLCERDAKKVGSSVLERSFANDRAKEPALFRLVTLRQVAHELLALSTERPIHGRGADPSHEKLVETLKSKLSDLTSPNGRDIDYWVKQTFWQHSPDSTHLEMLNIFELLKLIEARGFFAAPDSAKEIYAKLLRKVQVAALARPTPRSAKIITKEQLGEWLDNAITETAPTTVAGKRARQKMSKAGLDQQAIETAQDNRLFYRKEVLNSQYLSLSDRTLAESEVHAVLQENRALLDAGIIRDTGVEFHARCLTALRNIQQASPTNARPPLAFLQGCMYNLADRCLHRFVKAEP